MKIEIGETRRVFVFKKIGIVVKIPAASFFRGSLRYFSKEQGRWICKIRLRDFSFKFFLEYLISGAWFNWSEFIFFLDNHKNPLLMPTYFSFFGLFNIQKRGKIVKIDDRELFTEILKIVSHDENIKRDIHVFSEHKNFCDENGKLKIVDYAGELTQKIILKYGEKISKEFNLNSKKKEKEMEKWMKLCQYQTIVGQTAPKLQREVLDEIRNLGRKKVIDRIAEEINHLSQAIDLFVGNLKNDEDERVALTALIRELLEKKEHLLVEEDLSSITKSCAEILLATHSLRTVYDFKVS